MDPDFTVHHVWFDGVALSRNAAFPEWFMKKMFRSRKKKLAKTKAEASPSLVQMYGYDFAKMMTNLISVKRILTGSIQRRRSPFICLRQNL